MTAAPEGRDPVPPRDVHVNDAEEMMASAAAAKHRAFVLRLYVTGLTICSERAIAAIKDVCEKHLAGRYDLQVIDVSHEPELARREQIIAAPTLVKSEPLPVRRLVGDLSNRPRVLSSLGIRP